jgi:hypothetical protein
MKAKDQEGSGVGTQNEKALFLQWGQGREAEEGEPARA